jgi:diguanylate cyclase (GGDEF)-like protein
MPFGLLHVRTEQLAALGRATPAAMLGYAINIIIALWALFGILPNGVLGTWAAFASGVCVSIGWRALRAGDRLRSTSLKGPRKTAKPLFFAVLLALPWSGLTLLYAGAINGHGEIVLIALAVGMAASGSILLAPVPTAAVTYQSIILLPLVAKCFLVLGTKDYLALGLLAVSYWFFLTALIMTTARLFDERLRALDALHASHLETEAAAMTDPLTGLANRRAFVLKLETPSRSEPDASGYALLYLDLNRFKNVNDVLGHHVGDAMLRACAKRIESAARSEDFVARLGGDEFAIIAEDTNDRAAADSLARRLLSELCKPYAIDGHALSVGASIGIALSSEFGTNGEELLKQADLAMYASKASQESIRYFEPSMERRAKDRHELEARLRSALRQNAFALYFQPIRNLASGSITGLEALIRWPQPDGHVLPPDEFLPLAASLGFSEEIGDWVINEACAQAASWPRDVIISVNVSPPQISSGKLLAQIEQALARTMLPPRRLQLEVTEATLLQNDWVVRDTLDKIRALGVSISLDDFGSGYSSLSYLVSFPFDRIKLDRQFIAKDRPNDSWAIVRAVVQLAKTLRCSVVAEGIECAAQLERLRSIGVSDGQGYLLGRPQSKEDTLLLLQDRAAYRLPEVPVKYA